MKKVIYLIVSIILGIFPTSCVGRTQNRIYTNPVGDEFPIMMTSTMFAAQVCPEVYQDIENIGCNMASCGFGYPQDIRRHAINAAHTNLKLSIRPHKLEYLNEETMAELAKYDNLVGFEVMDEPSEEKFEILADVMDDFERLPNAKFCYSNLLPTYATQKQLGAKSYRKYIESYIKTNRPSVLSFDNYPVLKDGLMEDYYQNLEIIRYYSQRNNIPFWGYALTSQFKNQAYPTRSTISFQIYSNIAYGAQGIAYYPYKQHDSETIALATADLKKTPLYYVVQDFNKEFKFYSSYFLNSSVKGVWHLGDVLPKGTKMYKSKRGLPKLSTESTNGFVVSLFLKDGKQYLLLLNKDYNDAQSVTVLYDSPLLRIQYDSKEETYKSGIYKIIVPAGEILLFKM